MLRNFGHLMNQYSAAYYGYMWAEVGGRLGGNLSPSTVAQSMLGGRKRTVRRRPLCWSVLIAIKRATMPRRSSLRTCLPPVSRQIA